ncbi:type VI secretion system-associated FHA domain protein TagH [Roseospira navarrensis]|uniref:Type VI secretion system-associated FHA domain protein TagH n=1 Tax=Roseospira navarrensis TaxID=140058 RepID=A0A7X1ZEU7_9PROT|nr:type VI secretion system-associated FHA domain protein TagH [Roseospira navarrensis]MQX35940.1 type VI secretion system-associated FHA domain protein TagH [Roseospira navarrensis]
MGAKLSLVLAVSPTGGTPRGETRTLESGALTVGRGPDNDWILADPERHLSKQHCEIAYTGDAFVVTDTSTNGVFVNSADQPIGRGSTVVLNQGDVLRLGAYELRATIDDDVERSDVVDYQRDRSAWPEFEDKTYYGHDPTADRDIGSDTDDLSPLDDQSDWNDDPIRPARRPRAPATPSDHIPSERDSMPIQRVQHQPAPKVLGDDWDADLDALLGDAPLTPGGGSGRKAGPDRDPADSGGGAFGRRPQAPPPAEPPPAEPPPAETNGGAPDDPDDLDALLGADPLGGDAPPARPDRDAGKAEAPPARAAPSAPPARPTPATPASGADPFADGDDPGTAAGPFGGLRPSPPTPPPGEAAGTPPPTGPRPTAPQSPPKPPAPASAATGAVDTAGAQALVDAFLRGADLPALPHGQSPEALFETAGALLAVMTDGVRDLLAARATLKSEMRAEQTMIRAKGNNALKFSVNAQEALERLLAPPAGAYMDGKAAAQEAFRDLRGHEIATMAGSSAAIRAVLSAFDPAALESRLEGRQGGLGGLLSGGRKAKLWELYESHYRELADEAAEDFDSRFNREFRKAYEKLVKDL